MGILTRPGGLCLVLALCCGSAAGLAQEHQPDPIVGTWKLDRSQSRMSEMPGMPKEQTEIYRESSRGEIEMTLSRLSADGATTTARLAWPSTGGVVEYRQGTSPKGELLVESLLAPGDWYVIYMQDGRQYGTLHKVVSPDGKMLRETFKGTIQGNSVEIVAVLHRQ